MSLRSVHLASTHRAFDVRIFERECVTLAEAGFDVTLIVPHESDVVARGVKIQAVDLPESGTERLTKTLWKVFQAALREPKDSVFHVHDAELLPYAIALALTGRRVVYDVHEYTPRQVLAQHWIPPAIRPAVAVYYEILERIGGFLFNHIFAAWPRIRDRYPFRKTTLLRNYPSRHEFAAVDIDTYASRPNLIVYVGGISEARGIFELLDALAQLPGHFEARLALAGTFYPSELEHRVQQHPQFARTDYHGWLHRPGLADMMSQARIGYCVLQPTPQHVISYPNKLFEYMAAGLPVVASDFPVWREIVEEAGCGLLVDPQDPESIADALKYLLEHPEEAEAYGRRGRQEFLSRRNWETEGERLVGVYDRLARAS